MAGDWIKMRTDLSEDPAVIAVACALGIDEDTVVGKLHRLWSWADAHTKTGSADSVTFEWIDKKVRTEGFAKAMESARWLERTDDGIRIPKFNIHNGKSAKKRALSARRAAKSRSHKSSARSATKSAPREEKRREENTDTSNDVSVARTRRFSKPTIEQVMAYCLERKNGIDAEKFCAHYESKGWKIGKTPMKDWKAAVHTWELNEADRKPKQQQVASDDDKKSWNPNAND